MRWVPTRARTVAVGLLAAAALAAAGYGADRLFEQALLRRSVAAYAQVRANVVSIHADQAEDGYVLIAGDSQAELAAPDPSSCGRKFVNAGLGGTNAANYLAFLVGIRFSHRASVAVVTLGTNHLSRKRDWAAPGAADAYERDLERVVRALQAVADRVVVAAVPPIGRALDRFLDRAGVTNLTRCQKTLCARLGCEQTDPYASYREPDFNTMRLEATRDGVHLSDYRPAFRVLDPLLCRGAPAARATPPVSTR